MKKNLITIAVTATLGLVALNASADDMFRGAWYVLPGVSYMNTDNDLRAKNGPGVFLKLGKELSESWDVQGGIDYNTARQDTGIAGVGGRYRQTTLGADALYMFSRSNLRPFLLAGLGVARNDIDYTAPNVTVNGEKTSWMGDFGFGAQYLFNDNFGIQADVREQWSRGKLSALNNITGASGSASGGIANTLFNLDGIFRFGAPAPVVAAAAPEPAPMPVVEPTPAPAPEAAPVAAPEPVACKPTIETISISAEKLFGFDKYKLQVGSKPILDETAAKIKANPDIKVVMVTGYTDRIGSEQYNQKLSERRANVVKEYLVSQGIDTSRLQAIGKGESDPVVQCTGNKVTKKLKDCLAPNRRVEITAEQQRDEGCK